MQFDVRYEVTEIKEQYFFPSRFNNYTRLTFNRLIVYVIWNIDSDELLIYLDKVMSQLTLSWARSTGFEIH